ncbi:uncharacterized protein LOC129313457 isoform X2 [Prosopis cineraria]|uniref:uncharacterized protein LOC129313457 isoform X2 n=1 Tax=Prosopis cineraria TaxID=364024 RepID=UPI0024107BCC|nr:uncharacterized protein LOC129313457 isoform X2 [Prosopis cineraria]
MPLALLLTLCLQQIIVGPFAFLERRKPIAIIVLGLLASKKLMETTTTIRTQLLHVGHVKKMELAYFSLNSKSTLFTLSMASIVLWEELIVRKCDGLKHLVTSDGDDYEDQKNCSSIFPNLKKLEIRECDDIEFLFPSTISLEIKKLRSWTIKDAPKLTYIVGKNQHKDIFANQYQQNELHLDLLALQCLCFQGVPNVVSICAMNFDVLVPQSLQTISLADCGIESFNEWKFHTSEELLDWKITKETIASTDRVTSLQIVQSPLIQSLKNIKHMKLQNCSKLISLFTLPTASTVLLENLTIESCHQLKCIVEDEDNAQGSRNCSYIFPTLKNLEIEDCEGLEFLFPSSSFVQLKSLKSLTIKGASELKYAIEKCQHEDHLSNQNQHHEMHFDLPVLEFLSFQHIPKMRLNLSIDTVHLQATQGLTMQSLINIKKMELVNCATLISLFALHDASILSLEELTIEGCHQLKYIVADEGGATTHMNHKSIFPKLKRLDISFCNAMEYLFPASTFRSPMHLECLSIFGAHELEYVLGRSSHDYNLSHQNENMKTCIDFPALKELWIYYVPKLVSLCPENYCLKGLSMKFIKLDIDISSMFSIRSFNDFMVCDHATQGDSKTTKATEMRLHILEELTLKNSKIEEIFNLKNLDAKKNEKKLEPLTSSLELLLLEDLSELRNICVGPKYIMSLNNLSSLVIKRCTKLEVVFSASTLRTLPQLRRLEISECEELVEIIEDDIEESARDHLPHQPCFPVLKYLSVESCHKLKYLFSITVSGVLPQLERLFVIDASALEHVLIRPNESKEMTVKDLLPKLRYVTIGRNISIINICHGIDFQILANDSIVLGCPKFSFHETTTSSQLHHDGHEDMLRSNVEAKTEEKLSSHLNTNLLDMEDTKGRPSFQQSRIGSPNFIGDGLGGREVQNEKFMEDLRQPTNTENLSKIVEERVEDGTSLETLYRPSSSTSTKIVEERDEEGASLETLHPASLPPKNVSIHASPNRDNVTVEDSKLSLLQFSTPTETMPSFLETNNQASIVPEVQEIIDMMKLEGFDRSILAKALETRPQLRLSSNDRSTRVLCMSYRILLDILNILTTRTPFTITEADKRLLAEHLKDAYFFGFDKEWIESIKTKVIDCEISEGDRIQEVLKGLDNDLMTNEVMLAAIHDEEVEAARVVQVAQQEHVNVMARHAQLLKARQDILARRHQFREIIATKSRHFGF